MAGEIKYRVWNGVRFNYGYINRKGSQVYWDPHYDPQRFTGLKDKNGKEIYEGDILRFTQEHDGFLGGDQLVQRQVRWNTYYGAGWDFGRSFKDGEKRWSYPSPPPDAEVIGNIYENPERLEGK